MLVRFDSRAGSITMFGDIAVRLLRMMGQSGALPGAILAPDIPAAVARLRAALAAEGGEPAPAAERTREERGSGEGEPKVSLRQRAFPLIELLERAAQRDAEVVWDEERRSVM
jgi:hypothetical protein